VKQFSPGKMVQKLLAVNVIGITAIIGYLSGTIASIMPPVDSQATAQVATITNRILQRLNSCFREMSYGEKLKGLS
jgi:ethanolamine transporter EutH